MAKLSDKDRAFVEAYNDIARYPTLADVASKLGIAYKTTKNTAVLLRRKGAKLVARSGKAALPSAVPDAHREVPELPESEEDINDLLARAITHNEKQFKRHQARQLVNLKIRVHGPIGVAGIPDPHLNNPGTLLRKALNDAEKIRDTEGLYCVGIGDWLDNFIIGRLERERRDDIMTHSDANRLQEHYVLILIEKLIAAIGGNHNDWPAMLGGVDMLGKLFTDLGLGAIYDPDEVRVRLNLPGGAKFTHLARHIFPGHSRFHPTHGVLSWLLERWQGEDVAWGGHIHSSGHMSLTRNYEGAVRTVHGVQLASYKAVDGYAKKIGCRENTPFVTPIVIHDPETGKTSFFDDLDEGIEYLAFKRRAL